MNCKAVIAQVQRMVLIPTLMHVEACHEHASMTDADHQQKAMQGLGGRELHLNIPVRIKAQFEQRMVDRVGIQRSPDD